MVASFAAAAARDAQSWTQIVRIEGIGDYDGQHTWTINPPDFVGSSDERYQNRDTLSAIVNISPERTKSVLGGMPEAGGVTVELVDYLDLITSARRTDAPAVAYLSADATASATTLTVSDGSLLSAGNSVVWIGNEAIRIASRSSGTLTVETSGRGWLATDAVAHESGAAVYATPPYLRGRRMVVYLAPTDADNDSVATEYVIGSYRIDGCKLTGMLGVWRLSGSTEIRDLSRLIAGRVPVALQVVSIDDAFQIRWTPMDGMRAAFDGHAPLNTLSIWPDGRAWLREDETGEVLSVDATNIAAPTIASRGDMGTVPEEWPPGSILRPVITSDTAYGSFRWSPGPTPSTDRASGTWNVSAHPVDILLCLLTSAAYIDDPRELENYSADGNWSSLPPGFGIGYPIDRIDVSSFLTVRARLQHVQLTGVVIGEAETSTLAEWATKNILEPFGWYLVTVGTQLTLVAPSIPLAGETPAAELGVEDIIEYTDPEESYDLVAGAITYQHRGTRGEKLSVTVRASDLTGLTGGRAQYTIEDEPILIEVPGVIAGEVGTSALLALIAQRRLMRAVRAPWRITLTLAAEHYLLSEGQTVEITHPDLPDLDTGARGWVSVPAQIVASTRVTLDDESRAARRITVLVYPGFSAVRIAPSAIITARSGSGPWTLTVAANRYTSPDADDDLGLAATDADAFTDGDTVKTITRAGVDVLTDLEVTSVGTNSIEVSGSVAPTVGDVLVFRDYAAATTTQQTQYGAWAGLTGEIVSGVPAVRYGEP